MPIDLHAMMCAHLHDQQPLEAEMGTRNSSAGSHLLLLLPIKTTCIKPNPLSVPTLQLPYQTQQQNGTSKQLLGAQFGRLASQGRGSVPTGIFWALLAHIPHEFNSYSVLLLLLLLLT
jgi:hypothetical protein